MADLSQATRDAVREGAKRSAAIVLPLVFEYLGTPSALLDVGAGEGWWSRQAFELNVGNVHALDLNADAAAPAWWIERWDAEASDPLPLEFDRKWPLALCLEMAEHVSPAAGDHLVAELTRVADAVLWSAAIPGQGGDGHVNEQWPDYWNERFNRLSWMLTDPFRDTLWKRPEVEPWYRQNLLLAVPHGVTVRVEGSEPLPMRSGSPRPLVDPVTWAHHRGVPPPGLV